MQNLKSKYEQKEMKVSESLWERLEEKLDQVPAKEEKSKIVWLRYVAVVLLMIGLGGSFLMINHKSDIKDNQEFANQTENSNPIKTIENNEVETLNPIKVNSEKDNQKLAVEDKGSSTPLRMTEEIRKESQIINQVSEKEIIKNNEPNIIPQPEVKLAQNEIQKPKERTKYISSSDLLFGVEIDKAKSETPKSAMGINVSKPKNDSDFPNPKRIKLFGITLYDKDSITTK